MLIFIITLTYLYIFLVNKTNIEIAIINNIKTNLNKEKINIKDKIVSNTLYKIESIQKEIPKEPIKEIINISQNRNYKVYIYNTHDTEEYSEPISNGYSITPNVKIASYILKDHLNDLGIQTIVEKRKIKDYLNKYKLNYYGSYDASRSYLQDSMKNNDFKIIIDLHRDSIKKEKSTTIINDKNYAKLLFVLTTKHNNYKENEIFVKKLNSILNKNYQSLSRGIMYREDVIFNQDLSPHAILLEVGGVENTIEEVNNSLEAFSKVIKEYLNNEELNG